MSMNGLVGINKPRGSTSAQILLKLQDVFAKSSLFWDHIYDSQGKPLKKRRFQQRVKMGHGGTLDPLATGVLVVGIGSATKRLGEFLHCSKEYEATAVFGSITDTYDSEGKVIFRKPYQHVTRERVINALSQFRGEIMQKPPLYSALKMDGKPLYDYAREGKELPREIESRKVIIECIELTDWNTEHNWPEPEEALLGEDSSNVQVGKVLELIQPAEGINHCSSNQKALFTAKRSLDETTDNGIGDELDDGNRPKLKQRLYEKPPSFSVRMTVSSGTYVRSIIHDLGVALGSGAYIVKLERTRQGQFDLKGGNVLNWKFWDENDWEEKLKGLLEVGKGSKME